LYWLYFLLPAAYWVPHCLWLCLNFIQSFCTFWITIIPFHDIYAPFPCCWLVIIKNFSNFPMWYIHNKYFLTPDHGFVTTILVYLYISLQDICLKNIDCLCLKLCLYLKCTRSLHCLNPFFAGLQKWWLW